MCTWSNLAPGVLKVPTNVIIMYTVGYCISFMIIWNDMIGKTIKKIGNGQYFITPFGGPPASTTSSPIKLCTQSISLHQMIFENWHKASTNTCNHRIHFDCTYSSQPAGLDHSSLMLLDNMFDYNSIGFIIFFTTKYS